MRHFVTSASFADCLHFVFFVQRRFVPSSSGLPSVSLRGCGFPLFGESVSAVQFPPLLQSRYRVPVVSSPWLSRGSDPPSSCGGSFGVVTVVALFPALRILAIRPCCRDPTGVNLRVDPDVCTCTTCTSCLCTRFACQFRQLLRLLHYVHVHALSVHAFEPSRREKRWVSEPRQGVAHPSDSG